MASNLTTSAMPIHGNGGHAKVVRELVLTPTDGWIIAVGDNAARQQEVRRIPHIYAIGVHPSATVSPTAKLGPGTVVMAGAVVQADAIVGAHCILNTGCTLDHDCVIEDFAHIAPGVHLCGGVKVGEGALIGVGSCAVPRSQVTQWSIVPAGSVIK